MRNLSKALSDGFSTVRVYSLVSALVWADAHTDAPDRTAAQREEDFQQFHK